MLVLITRPLPDAEDTAVQVQKRGGTPIIAPLLAIQGEPANAQQVVSHAQAQSAAVIITSRQAIRQLAAIPERHYPLWVVGEQSAHYAKECGFSTLYYGGETVEALLTLLRCQPLSARWVYAAGDITHTDLAKEMHGRMETIIVYRAIPTPGITTKVLTQLGTQPKSIGLFFSKRTATLFLEQCRSLGGTALLHKMDAIGLSNTITATLQESEYFHAVHVASKPTHAAMMLALTDLWESHAQFTQPF